MVLKVDDTARAAIEPHLDPGEELLWASECHHSRDMVAVINGVFWLLVQAAAFVVNGGYLLSKFRLRDPWWEVGLHGIGAAILIWFFVSTARAFFGPKLVRFAAITDERLWLRGDKCQIMKSISGRVFTGVETRKAGARQTISTFVEDEENADFNLELPGVLHGDLAERLIRQKFMKTGEPHETL